MLRLENIRPWFSLSTQGCLEQQPREFKSTCLLPTSFTDRRIQKKKVSLSNVQIYQVLRPFSGAVQKTCAINDKQVMKVIFI